MLVILLIFVFICVGIGAATSMNGKQLQPNCEIDTSIKTRDDFIKKFNEISKIQEENLKYRNKWEKVHLGTIALVLWAISICLILAFASQIKGTLGMICTILILFVLPIFGILGHEYKKICVNRATKAIDETQAKLYSLGCSYLANYHCITVEKLLYDLPYVFNAQINQTNWWMSINNVDVINEALKIKYNYVMTDLEKSNLQVQQLRLQNEGLAIDNQQKKFWTCTFCGNMNRADDMQCIKCGGQRVN